MTIGDFRTGIKIVSCMLTAAASLLIVQPESSAQFCPVPNAPAAPAASVCPAGTSLIGSLPLVIGPADSGKTYCVNVSPTSSNTGGITIQGASNIIIEGAGRQIFGTIKILDSQNVEVRNLITAEELLVYNSTGQATKNITIKRSQFGGAIGQAFDAQAVNNLTVLDSVFKCTCAAPTSSADDFMCVHLFPENVAPGNALDPLDFERNMVESNCVKNVKLVANVPVGETQRVRHVLKDNFFHSTFNVQNGNEPSNITWRSSPGGLTPATRNVFENNTLISEGNANGFYGRDDDDNVDFRGNCVEVKNPSSLKVFGGAMFFTNGSDAPTDASGLFFYNNRVYSRTNAALNFQGIDPAVPGSPDRIILVGNVFASDQDFAFINSQTFASELWVHNTFYSGSSSAFSVDAPKFGVGALNEFYDNIFACGKLTWDGRADCMSILYDNLADHHQASHNLFFNYVRSPVQVYYHWQVDLPQWLAGGNDVGSKEGDPGFVNRSALDFKINAASPARGLARVCSSPGQTYCSGSDAGALQYATGQPPPLPGADMVAPSAPANFKAN